MNLPPLLEIKPLHRPPHVPVRVPGSRRLTHCALIRAALSQGRTRLENAFFGEDTELLIDGLKRLGFEIQAAPERHEIEVVGHGGQIPATEAELYIANSDTAARLLAALVCRGNGRYRIYGTPLMHEQLMEDLFDALNKLGVRTESNSGYLPLIIHANGLRSGRVTLQAPAMNQFASALMVAAAGSGLELEIPEESFGCLAMSKQLIQQWPQTEPRRYVVEPDLGSASYFSAASFITGGTIRVLNWPEQSRQTGAQFPQFLPPPSTVACNRHPGDFLLPLAVCALFNNQPTTFTGISLLRHCQADRFKLLAAELRKTGAQIETTKDAITFSPAKPGQLHGAELDPGTDPRLAMAFAVLGLKVPGIRLKNPECISATFPDFFEQLERLRCVVVAIDGTSGSGKSTVAKLIAKTHGFVHVDTGSTYRAVTWFCLQRGIDCNNPEAVIGALRDLKIDFELTQDRAIMLINGQDPGEAVRSEAVNKNVSLVARIPEVRERLVAEQRALLRFGSLVMEGRDIGSVVFAETPFKFYVDADPTVRAERRANDGYTDQVAKRDQIDSTRKASPLVKAADAFFVDTSHSVPQQTADLVLNELKRRGL